MNFIQTHTHTLTHTQTYIPEALLTYFIFILYVSSPFPLEYELRSIQIFLLEASSAYFFKIINFLAALGLRCCTRAFSSCGERELPFVAVHGLLTVVASLVAEHGLQACGLQQLWHAGSRAQAQQLWRTGLVALWHVGIFLDQRSNPCPLHWQVDS